MALDDIFKKIEQKTQADIASINKDAKEKCDAIDKETERIIKILKEENRIAADLKSKKLKEYLLQEARINIAQEKLKRKSKAISSVFAEALDRLEKLPEKEYMAWMEKTILAVIEHGENEIILPTKLVKSIAVKGFLENINKKLEGKSHVELSKGKQEIKGGFILKKQKREINYSFQSLLEEKRNDIKLKISRVLFKDS